MRIELSLDEVVEEVWLTADKDDAKCVLEAYGNNLSDFQWKLLDQVLFGCEKTFQYAEEKSDNAIKLHQILDRILF